MIFSRDSINPSAGKRPAIVLQEMMDDLPSSESRGWWVSYLDILTLMIVLCAILVVLKASVVDDTQLQLVDQITVAPEAVVIDDVIAVSPLSQKRQAWQTAFVSLIENENLEAQVSVRKAERGLKLDFSAGVLFSDDRVSLSRAGRALLDQLGPELIRSGATLLIVGHNDITEGLAKEFASKEELAQERAIDVLDYLARLGMSDKRMKVLPFNDDRKHTHRISVILSAN